MKIKLISILVILCLIFTTTNICATDENKDNIMIKTEDDHVSFSQATIETKGEYVTVDVMETNKLSTETGKPVLPVYVKTFIYPRGTKIKNVECLISEIKSEVINGKIQPAQEPKPRIYLETNVNGEQDNNEIIEDESVYSSSDLYPSKWYDYSIGCGLHDGRDSIFLNVVAYPIRYSPAENTIYSINSIDICVTYEENLQKDPSVGPYDLLIITPNRFKLALLPLYFHKEKMGVPTKIVSVESIYRNYTGKDKPEQIKYFIKYAKDTWNITYVLLVGGLNSYFYADDRDNINEGSKAWFVPVRYVDPYYYGGHISDLYYSDLYRINESTQAKEFEDWDKNNNGVFGEVGEEMDLYPDVYYGRLPCRNIFEVHKMVKKIIRYEKPTIFSKDWVKRMLAIGGLTFEFIEDEPDGEYLCNLSLDYMDDKIDDPVRVYASNVDPPRPAPEDIIKEFSKGAGFVLFQGHGNAFMWDTHWPNTDGNWTGGIMQFFFPFFRNGRKQPIVVVGGCHNGIFNVSFIKTLLDTVMDTDTSTYHAYGIPVRTCFSWAICAKRDGGAISCTGCTDYGIGNPMEPLGLSGELECNFFYKIGKDNVTNLGDAHGGSIEKYLNENDMGSDYSSQAYAITEFQLFGDPSLKIGGY